MQKAHDSSKNQAWKNYPDITTPILAEELNRNETSVDTIDDRVVAMDTTKANQTDLLTCISDITYNSANGKFTVTKKNGNTVEIDTNLEKLAVNFDYDDDPTSQHYQQLIITLDDGTVKYVDLSALITEYEFTTSSVIQFTVSSGSVSATILNGSITETMLETNFLANCRAAKNGADASALVSEGWAKGTQNGVDVDSSSPYYHNNSKYFKEQAQAAASGQVQADWNEDDPTSKAFINNKPTIPDSVDDLSGGTLAGQVSANVTSMASLTTAQLRDATISTQNLTAGTSQLAAGSIYLYFTT